MSGTGTVGCRGGCGHGKVTVLAAGEMASSDVVVDLAAGAFAKSSAIGSDLC